MIAHLDMAYDIAKMRRKESAANADAPHGSASENPVAAPRALKPALGEMLRHFHFRAGTHRGAAAH